MLLQRANDWLSRHSSLQVVNVEVIEVSGVYGTGSSGCVESVKNLSQTALPAFLKLLRYCCHNRFCLAYVAMIDIFQFIILGFKWSTNFKM